MTGTADPLDPVEFRKALEKVPGRLFLELTSRLEEYGKDFAARTMYGEASRNLANRSSFLASNFKSETVGQNPDEWRLLVFTTTLYALHEDSKGTHGGPPPIHGISGRT